MLISLIRVKLICNDWKLPYGLFAPVICVYRIVPLVVLKVMTSGTFRFLMVETLVVFERVTLMSMDSDLSVAGFSLWEYLPSIPFSIWSLGDLPNVIQENCSCIDLVRGRIQKFPDWVDNEITTINTCWEATQRAMAAKLTRLIHKIAIQLDLVAESCTICSSRPRRPVRELLDTPSYKLCWSSGGLITEGRDVTNSESVPFVTDWPTEARLHSIGLELFLCFIIISTPGGGGGSWHHAIEFRSEPRRLYALFVTAVTLHFRCCAVDPLFSRNGVKSVLIDLTTYGKRPDEGRSVAEVGELVCL
jgi:hypothetical protein